MIKLFLRQLLKKCDVTIRLNGDDLTVTIKIGDATLWQKTFDLLKDGVL